MTDSAGTDPNQQTGPAGIPWLPYLSDLMSTYLGVVSQQAMRISGVYQRMASGSYGMDQWANDSAMLFTSFVDDCVELTSAYAQPSAGDSVPTLVFVLDPAAEVGNPKSVYLRARVTETDELKKTPLLRIGGSGQIDPGKVTLTLSSRRRLLEVRLAGLAGLRAGYYMGWVYVSGPGNAKIPLANVQVVKLERAGPPSRPRVTRSRGSRS